VRDHGTQQAGGIAELAGDESMGDVEDVRWHVKSASVLDRFVVWLALPALLPEPILTWWLGFYTQDSPP